MTAPRGLSQPPTSFIGSQCQGIHHAPLNTYKHKNHLSEKLHHTKPHTFRARENPCPARMRLDARNHYPQIKHHTPPPSGAETNSLTDPPFPAGVHPSRFPPTRGRRTSGPVASKPNSVFSGDPPKGAENVCRVHQNLKPTTGQVHPTNRLKLGDPRYAGRPRSRGAP